MTPSWESQVNDKTGIKTERVPDVELSTRSASAGVIQSDTHEDRLSEGAQRNIHLWMESGEKGWRKWEIKLK